MLFRGVIGVILPNNTQYNTLHGQNNMLLWCYQQTQKSGCYGNTPNNMLQGCYQKVLRKGVIGVNNARNMFYNTKTKL